MKKLNESNEKHSDTTLQRKKFRDGGYNWLTTTFKL